MARDARTIFALSSGAPPAAIAIIRVSGPQAVVALERLAGRLPEPRHAKLAALRDPATGEQLDRALLLWLPGPGTATGEDLAEFHVHGGRAVVAAVLAALSGLRGLRAAEAGEFTRRALENGRIDLAEAEALADLLTAETESERRAALNGLEGHVPRQIAAWRAELVGLIAQIDADLEFGEEDDGIAPSDVAPSLLELAKQMEAALASPMRDRARDGIRVVISGPPNAGKSSLLNALASRDAAIVSDIPGTTRDVIEVPVALGGIPFLLCDTAGVRESDDAIEQLGVAVALQRAATSDILLWLGAVDDAPEHDCCIKVATKIDAEWGDPRADVHTSSTTGSGLAQLADFLRSRGEALLRGPPALWPAYRIAAVRQARLSLLAAVQSEDLLLTSELCRDAAQALLNTTPAGASEEVLSALFSRFCIGK